MMLISLLALPMAAGIVIYPMFLAFFKWQVDRGDIPISVDLSMMALRRALGLSFMLFVIMLMSMSR